MFYFVKVLQAGGLGIILIGFLAKFPHLMDKSLFLTGIFVFAAGWALETYLMKK